MPMGRKLSSRTPKIWTPSNRAFIPDLRDAFVPIMLVRLCKERRRSKTFGWCGAETMRSIFLLLLCVACLAEHF